MKVELINVFGNDEMVCDCARVSYAKESSGYTIEQNDKLLRFLAKHNHWSPFSHPRVQFRLEVPIYVERQLIKTQVGVEYNSVSGRYVDFSDTYTRIPLGEWRKQSESSKQGSDGLVEEDFQYRATILQDDIINKCKKYYSELIEMGISKEQCRTILPLNLNTTIIWTGSFYSFVRLCKQRLKEDAQKETRYVVKRMLSEVYKNGSFKKSLEVFELEEI